MIDKHLFEGFLEFGFKTNKPKLFFLTLFSRQNLRKKIHYQYNGHYHQLFFLFLIIPINNNDIIHDKFDNINGNEKRKLSIKNCEFDI